MRKILNLEKGKDQDSLDAIVLELYSEQLSLPNTGVVFTSRKEERITSIVSHYVCSSDQLSKGMDSKYGELRKIARTYLEDDLAEVDAKVEHRHMDGGWNPLCDGGLRTFFKKDYLNSDSI